MTGLDDLLAGRTRPGAYRADASADEVRAPVEAAGWRFAAIDGTHADKPGVLAAVGEALEFPPWYGRNFDALADCLRDVAGQDGRGTLLAWTGWTSLAGADRRSFEVLLEVFAERAADPPPFVVLLLGPGPDVDVPALT